MTLILCFLLQAGDLATTLLFLSRGVAEGNPLVRAALAAPVHPALTLLAIKAAACGMAWFAWKTGRHRLITRANVLFGLCVAWNLAACIGR